MKPDAFETAGQHPWHPRGPEERAIARGGAHVADRAALGGRDPSRFPRHFIRERAPLEIALGGARAHRGRRHRSQRDADVLAALEGRIERETRRNARDRDLHGAPATRLEKCGGRARGEARKARAGQQLVGPEHGDARRGAEAVEGYRALTGWTEGRQPRLDCQQYDDHIRRGRRVDDVAANRRHVTHLMAAHDLGTFDERPQRALKVCRGLDPPVRYPRAEADRPVDLDRIESGDTLQADDVARVEPAAMDLDHEIRSSGEEAPVDAEPSAELDRLA